MYYGEARNFNENLKDTYRLIYRKKRLYALDRQIEAELKAARKNGKVIILERGLNSVTTQEVLEKLLKFGVNITERTLQNYAKNGLVKKPELKSLGQGRGRKTNWDNNAPFEVIASWRMIHGYGVAPESVRAVRTFALIAEELIAEYAKEYVKNGVKNDMDDIVLEILEKMRIDAPDDLVILRNTTLSTKQPIDQLPFVWLYTKLETIRREKSGNPKIASLLTVYGDLLPKSENTIQGKED